MKQILLLLFISINCRAEVPEHLIHDNTQYVDDYAGVFTSQEKQQLNSRIHSFFDTVQISIVTVKTLGGLEPYEFATRLGNKWGVGSKSSNGMLMLVCPGEHKIFLATGGGIQGDMPDIVTGRLIRERAIPLFKKGKIFEGVDNLLAGCIETLSPSSKVLHDAQRFDDPASVPWYLWILIPLSAGIVGWYLIYRRLKKKRQDKTTESLYTSYRLAQSRRSSNNYDSDSYNASSSYISSSDYGSSSSSSDSSSSSSSDYGSTDFGGGSFDGGGSGDSW